MPSKFQSKPYTQLNMGVNLRGLTGGLTMVPGQATDAMDVLPREDGAIFKHYGWLRKNPGALTGRPVALKGFQYKGKNADTGGGDTARAGNYGVADDSGPADFTRRIALYSGCVVLTTSTFYRWDAASQAFASVSLPGGVSVDLNPKPSIVVYNNNLYIVGYTDYNLRYDPTDEALYRWGWEAAPSVTPTSTPSAGGSAIAGATYKYGYTFVDMYTGEESPLSATVSFTPAGGNLQTTIACTAYTGSRHFNALAVATDSDVGIIIYRTDADRDTYNFLTLLNPGTTSYLDTGVQTVASIHPFQGTLRDEPRFSMLDVHKDQFYAATWNETRSTGSGQPTNQNRLYYNDFKSVKSYVERWDIRDYRELPLDEGDYISALAATQNMLLVFSPNTCYGVTTVPNLSSGRVDRITTKLPWSVGSVGPKAVHLAGGWLYFLSERGPYRWASGMMEPQWIGKNVAALFNDPTSGLCQLTPGRRRESEVVYDQDANVVRWIFPIGSPALLNTHLMYWVDADKYGGDPANGWFFASTMAQCLDFTMAIAGANPDGTPPDPLLRTPRMAFGDADGYVNTYELRSRRGGLPDSEVASGSVISASVSAVVVTTSSNPLLTQNDGLKGMLFEIAYSDGTTATRRILSNTATTVTVDVPLPTIPTTADTWYVAGIPSFWRSWIDHLGEPHRRKSMLSLEMTYDLRGINSQVLDVAVLSGDMNQGLDRTRTAALTDYNEKMLISRTDLYFSYEIANSRPDEMWTLMAIEPEFQVLDRKRKE